MTRGSWRVLLVTVLLALVGGSAIPQGSGVAQAVTGTDACPHGGVPATAFSDTVRSVHRAAIDCAVWWEVVEGRSDTSFAPGVEVTRGQAAAMVARLLRRTGAAADAAPSAGFDDTVGHRFEADIDLLAALGILQGVTSSRFAPDQPIDRAQMASVLARTFAEAYDAPLPPGTVSFTDVAVDSVHREAIGRLVAAGITVGVTATRYAPAVPVTRAQMATFVMRSAGRLVEQGLAVPPTSSPGVDDAYGSRMRAAWVHLFEPDLKTRAGIATVVDELVAADVTAVFAQVIRRHDAYYVSDVLPRTPDPGLEPGLDVLDELLRVAHDRGIEVHAWFSVAPTWHDVYADLEPPEGWVATEHGRTAPEAARWVTRTVDGQWSTYLDPGLLAVQDHVAAVVGELAARYPLDGIHLDYVRYESARHGYHPDALARYRSETGASGTPAPDDPAWSHWRRTQSQQIVRRARAAIDATGADVTLSAAVISWGAGPSRPDRAGFRGTRAFTQVLQDWDDWARAGDVDLVVPMNYFRAHDQEQAGWFEEWLAYERALAREVDAGVVPGIAGYLNRPDAVPEQVQQAMAAGDGAVLFSYHLPTIDGSRTVWRTLADSRWRYPPGR